MSIETNDILNSLAAQLEAVAHLLGSTDEAMPPEAAHGVAVILGGLAEQARAALMVTA